VHFSCELIPVPREEREYLIRELSLSEFGEEGLLVNGVTDLGDTEPCRRMLLEASVELKDRKPLRGAVAGLLFYRYLIELSRVRLKEVATVKESEVGRALPVPLQRALEHLKANFNRRVTVPELCRASNVTPQHLIRLFNKYLGASPIKYINRNKILCAVEMLRSTEKSVKEISYELGFENPNYFSRIFAREMGCSPAQKRDHIRNYQRKDNQKA
jgi:AraC-like DNA-binding protein